MVVVIVVAFVVLPLEASVVKAAACRAAEEDDDEVVAVAVASLAFWATTSSDIMAASSSVSWLLIVLESVIGFKEFGAVGSDSAKLQFSVLPLIGKVTFNSLLLLLLLVWGLWLVVLGLLSILLMYVGFFCPLPVYMFDIFLCGLVLQRHGMERKTNC